MLTCDVSVSIEMGDSRGRTRVVSKSRFCSLKRERKKTMGQDEEKRRYTDTTAVVGIARYR